jgi:DnaK suppressor protein
MLDPEQERYFRTVLNQQLHQLLREVGAGGTRSIRRSEDPPDFGDQASRESDNILSLRLRERESNLVTKIRGALKRLDEGRFGICEACGGKIAEKRLRYRPITTRCIRCKERQERQEAVLGLQSRTRRPSSVKVYMSDR